MDIYLHLHVTGLNDCSSLTDVSFLHLSTRFPGLRHISLLGTLVCGSSFSYLHVMSYGKVNICIYTCMHPQAPSSRHSSIIHPIIYLSTTLFLFDGALARIDTQFTDAAFRSLPELCKELTFFMCVLCPRITAEGISALMDCRNLREKGRLVIRDCTYVTQGSLLPLPASLDVYHDGVNRREFENDFDLFD